MFGVVAIALDTPDNYAMLAAQNRWQAKKSASK